MKGSDGTIPAATASKRTRESAERDYEKGQRAAEGRPSPKRSRATAKALEREGREAASPTALAQQAKQQARKRGAKKRNQIARKAARTRAMAGG